MTDDIIKRMKEAADELMASDDNLLHAIAAIAAHRCIQIIPYQAGFGDKPIICLPQRMYDRLLVIIPKDHPHD